MSGYQLPASPTQFSCITNNKRRIFQTSQTSPEHTAFSPAAPSALLAGTASFRQDLYNYFTLSSVEKKAVKALLPATLTFLGNQKLNGKFTLSQVITHTDGYLVWSFCWCCAQPHTTWLGLRKWAPHGNRQWLPLDLLPPGVLLGALLPLVHQLSTCLRAHVQAEQQTERLPLVNQRATLKPPWDDHSFLHPSQHMYKDSKSQDTFLVSIHIQTYRNIAQLRRFTMHNFNTLWTCCHH